MQKEDSVYKRQCLDGQSTPPRFPVVSMTLQCVSGACSFTYVIVGERGSNSDRPDVSDGPVARVDKTPAKQRARAKRR